MKTVLCGGCFNEIHLGHVHFLKECRKKGDKLVVVLANDFNNQKERALLAKERKENLLSLGLVDTVLVGTKSNPELIIQKVKPQIICLGYDQKLPFNGKNFPNIKVTRISQLPSYKKSSNKVIGRVFSGKKRAQKFLSEKEYANRILAAIGFFVFPGTLNLALARNGVDDLLVEKKKKKIFSFYKDKEERGGLVLYPVMIRFFPLVPLKTKEKKVWVVFPEKTGYNKTVSEVVSKINLRELLNLLDGDLAEIVF